jgi:hypothetical protein
VIVVTSDHGEMLGDHGYFRKCEPFEGSANIPLIVAAAPAIGFKPGCRCTQPVCLEDLMPTLIELAGAKRPQPMDGVSLVPVLRGEDRVLREWLHFEHAPCYSKAQAFHALTDGHYKYIWRPLDGTELLFDLDKDPREEHDLTRVVAQHETLERWRQRLVQRLAGRPEGSSDGTKLIPGRPYPALHATSSQKGSELAHSSSIPDFQITCAEPGTLAVEVEAGKTILAIKGGRGIGQATVRCNLDLWPQEFVVRAYLGGLEQIAIASGDLKLQGSVLSHSGHPALLHLWQHGKEGPQLDQASPYWMEIRTFDAEGKAIPGLPPKGGWFEMALPRALLNHTRELNLSWIDFYR